MFIDGKWVESEAGKRLEITNPATGELIATVPAGGKEDVNNARLAAEKAYHSWRKVEPEERSRLIRKLAALIESHSSELARTDSLNAGHPIRAMRNDVRIAVQDLSFIAGLYPELKGDTIPGQLGKVLNYTMREPFGVVGRIVPFNHPFMFAAQSLAAPLIAGNTVLLKSSSLTPLSALQLGKLIEEVFPPGVVNIVSGTGPQVGSAIASHPGIRRIALTGGLETGREVARLAAEHLKYVTLELGGKNPIIIFPDVEVDNAVSAAIKGMNFTWTAGQSCQSTSRCFIAGSLHDEFVERISSSLRQIKLGIPTLEDTEMGCLSSKAQLSKVESYVKVGISEGAKLVTGGKKPDNKELGNGNFFEPTLFDGVRFDSTLGQEEIFGPVLSVISWDDYEEMLKQVNSVQYGLTASIFTHDISKAHTLASDLEAGYIWINGPSTTRGVPFGGYKLSGIGRQGGIDELLSYTQVKSVQVTL